MHKLLAASLSVLFLFAMAVAQEKGTAKNEGVQQHLMNMEKKWAEAGKANNASMIDPMLSDNFVNMDSDGTVHSKAESLDRMKNAKWETNEVSDMQVTQSGKTAIVTGVWHGNGTDGNGKSVNAAERFVDTWQQMPDGRWECIASASAPMK
jgi:ketosteroid isomerase-like protein